MSWPPKHFYTRSMMWPQPLPRPSASSAPEPPPLQRGIHLVDLPPLTPGLANRDSGLAELGVVMQQVNLFGEVVSSQPSLKTSAEPDMSSINRLPFELLSEIFALSLPLIDRSWLFGETLAARKGGSSPNVPSHLRSPAVLTAVCTHWNAVATSTPRLWTRILVDDLCARRQLHWVSLHIKHSGTLPLVLHIRTRPRDPPSALVALLHAIIPHAQRWHTIVLFADRFRVADMRFLSTARAESLASAAIYEAYPDVRDQFWSWAMSLSSLRRATLSREDDIPTLMDRAPEIWEKLQDLSLVKSAFETLDILNLLRECPHIGTLHVDAFNWPMHRGSDELHVVEARNLRTLLVVNRATDTHTFFGHLRVPQLRHLAIADFADHCWDSDSQRELWSTVGTMLTSSGARLRRFLYTGDQEQLVELVQLDAFQDLEELSAYEMSATRIVLEQLTVESGKGLLPHLNDLSLGPTYDKDAVLDRMVLSRKGTLQILELWSVIYPYDLTVLRGACADWLTLYFRNMPCWY